MTHIEENIQKAEGMIRNRLPAIIPTIKPGRLTSIPMIMVSITTSQS
jgi:hypothetical protein